MSASANDQDQSPAQPEGAQRRIAFAAGLFQGEVTMGSLLESFAEGVVVIDSSGTILLVNAATEQMFGYPRQNLIGRPHGALIPDSLRPTHAQHEARFFQAPKSRRMGELLNLVGRRRDGSEFPVAISLSHLQTTQGTLVLALVSDNTLRKQYEAQLRENEDLFRLQVECVKDHAVFTLDARGQVLNWNAGAERLQGYREEEILGRPYAWFWLEEDRQAGRPEALLKRAEDEGRVRVEGWRLRKDGERFWAETLLTVLRDEQGKLRGFSTLTHDITERKRAEAALLESEELFRATFDQAAVGIAHVDQDGRMLRVNGKWCEILGYSAEELKTLRISDITHPDDLEASLHHLQLLAERKLGSYTLEKRYLHKNGSTVWMKLTVSGVFDPRGTLKFTVGVVEDISLRMQAEKEIQKLNAELRTRAAELEAANLELEAFNYTVAHDLRKPLTVVNGYCQAIQDRCVHNLGEHCAGYLREAYQGTLRMNQLIDTLLNFAQLAHVQLHRQTVDLSATAQAAAAELRATAPQRRVLFRIAPGVRLRADADLMQAVLANLLGNAWKYTGGLEEAQIEFGATELGGQQVCYVRDNGTGFAMEDAEKLFHPFQRLPGAEKFRGFGIGLATVDRIIRRHGGRIWAEGEPGKGAIFYFTLGNAEPAPE